MTKTATTDHLVFVTYDHEARAQYQRLSNKRVARTLENEDGSLTDLAGDGTVVGIERLWTR